MIEWNPTPKQRLVYNAEQKYINCLGEPRSGKSEAFFYKMRREIWEQPGIKCLITRDSGTPLLGITYKHLFEKHIITPNMIIGGMKGITQKPWPFIRFKNGSQLQFTPFDEMDTTKGGGGEYGIILIEEAHRFVRFQWEYMDTRLSQQFGNAIAPDGKAYTSNIKYKGLWSTQNPAGRGYLYQIFTREHPLAYYGQDDKYRGFKFYLIDNKDNLDPEYVKDMYSKPEHIRRKLLGANEDAAEGLVFPDFEHDLVVYKSPDGKQWNPPPHYRVIGGEDYGYQTTASFVWGCVSDDPAFVICFRNYRATHKTISQLCLEIREETKRIHNNGASWIDTARIDPSTNMRDGKSMDAKTVYELHMEQGMDFLLPAKRQKVMDRVSRLRDMMAPDPQKKYHPISNEFRAGGWPTLIITSDCVDLITEIEDWELKEMTTREKTVETPEEKNDHSIDSLSYMLQAFWGDASPENELTRSLREDTPAEALKKRIFADIELNMNKDVQHKQSGDMQLS